MEYGHSGTINMVARLDHIKCELFTLILHTNRKLRDLRPWARNNLEVTTG